MSSEVPQSFFDCHNILWQNSQIEKRCHEQSPPCCGFFFFLLISKYKFCIVLSLHIDDKTVRDSGILNSRNENLYHCLNAFFHLDYLDLFYFSVLPFSLPE